MKSIPRISQDNFDSQILLSHKGKTVVIFSADWCPYCVSFFNNWSEYARVDEVYIQTLQMWIQNYGILLELKSFQQWQFLKTEF